MKITMTCQTCLSEFKPKSHQRKHIYCSTQCRPKNKWMDGRDKVKQNPFSRTWKERMGKAAKARWRAWRELNPRPTDDPGPFTEDWLEISEAIRQRDNHSCLICRRKGDRGNIAKLKSLPVHHINEDRLDNRPENLATTCLSCHLNKAHYIPPRNNKTLTRWLDGWLKNKLRWYGYFEAVMNDEAMRKKNAKMKED